MNNVNRQGIVLIQQFESLRLCPYKDPAGNWTIGWGHLLVDDELDSYIDPAGIKDPVCISKEQARELLAIDVRKAMDAVERAVDRPLNDNQFSALVSFTFNLGEGNLRRSTLLRLINAGQMEEAADEFQLWAMHRKDGKLVRSDGLYARRRAEEVLFRTPAVQYTPELVAWAGEYDNPETARRGRVSGAMTIVVYPNTAEEAANGEVAAVVEPEGEREG